MASFTSAIAAGFLMFRQRIHTYNISLHTTFL